jgi:predicted MFS family arabinose efflux permease
LSTPDLAIGSLPPTNQLLDPRLKVMSQRQLKAGYLLITWLNIYAVIYYFGYLFFHLRHDFGFGNRENLLFAALNGLVYVPASWWGGRFAQRRGYFTALKLGFIGMAISLGAGTMMTSLPGQILAMLGWTLAVCLTWAPLEALASHKESRSGLAHMVGIYNVVWSGGAAVALFTGGVLLEALGRSSLYWLPAGVHVVQLGLLLWLERHSRRGEALAATPDTLPKPTEEVPDYAAHHVSPDRARLFLRMAWVANPFAYVAMNTVIPLIPDLASKLGLSTALAGMVGSVWMFARLAAFVVLWRWTAWHYHHGWLFGAYGALVASFAALLLIPSLAVIVVSQVAFGFAVGLIYYSSLFYAMDVGGETQGEHGGIHEALIGLGIFAGPAVGATALQFLPSQPGVGIWAVGGLLMAGGGGLVWLRARR